MWAPLYPNPNSPGNATTQEQVHQMLDAAGLGAVTNDQVIAPALFDLGLGADSEGYIFALRTAIPDDPDEFQAYMDLLRTQVRIMRVRPEGPADDQVEPVLAANPLPVQPERVSGTGTSELDLNPTLELLRQRIIDSHPGYTATDIRVDDWFDEPYPGLQRNMVTDLPEQDGVAGATTDATYIANDNVELPEGAFLVAYGTDHQATGKATYASVSVYADAEPATQTHPAKSELLWDRAIMFTPN